MKTNKLKPGVILLAIFFFVFLAYGQDVKEWVVPAKSKSMKNPVASDKESLDLGKMLWSKNCKSCHGAEGLGDGVKSKTLKLSCGDFSSEEFQAQTDGEIFYKITQGRDEMPSYAKKITSGNDRWALVNYIRTFE
ncbi:MAG: cytochrome c [Bacteroidales bacterium]|nr:cytochrome c [Bacteroidales bacterium]MCF8457049.1 cytochrome c [Bacteroidales bacterium]